MADYTKTNYRFNSDGLNITYDPLILPPGKFQILTNAISLFEGSLRSRFGQTRLNTSAISSPTDGNLPIYGFRRLSNTVGGSPAQHYVIRAGTELWAIDANNPAASQAREAVGFASDMGSLVTYRPSAVSFPWMYVFDRVRMVKYEVGGAVQPIGYPRPHSIHTTGSHNFAAARGSAASGSLTPSSTYSYRFSLYNNQTGAESLYNLIPDGTILVDVSATTDASHLNIDVTLPDLSLNTTNGGAYAGLGAGTGYAKIYREGGTVASWRYVTKVAYTGTSVTYNDALSDATLLASDPEDVDSDQPFTVTDAITGLDSAGNPLPFASDPILGYIVAVGDPNNPGYMYWTNKFDPDRQDPDNRLEVTAPQDPLQNVFLYNGRLMIFSKENLYEIYPGLDSVTVWTPSKTSCNRGLFTPLAFTVGPEIYFLGKDGIYATSGGVERSLTDDDLRPIFQGSTSVNGYSPVDFTKTAKMRMAYYKFELWFQYQSADSVVHYLVYNTQYKRWRAVNFGISTFSIYSDEYAVAALLYGSTDGFILSYSGTQDQGATSAKIPVEITTGSNTFGEPLVNKEFGNLTVDLDPQGTTVTGTVTMGTDSSSAVVTGTTSNSGRSKLYLNLNAQVAESLKLDLVWNASDVTPIVYGYEILWRREEPTLTAWAVTGTTHGLEGWQIIRSAYIALIANGTVILTVSVVNDDGTTSDTAYTITPHPTDRSKVFVPFNPTKGKLFNYHLTCGTATSFRFYPDLSEVHAKPWVTVLGYQKTNPFVGESAAATSSNASV